MAVQVFPRDRPHRLVGETKALEDHDALGGRILDRELDVRQHVAGVALGHEQRPSLAGRLDPEAPAVHHADPGGHGVDPETRPHQFEERQAGHDLDGDAVVGEEQLDSSLRHQRRAGDGVEDLAVAGRRLGQGVDDLGVDLLERPGPVVHTVEAAGVGNGDGRRMTGGADPPVGDPPDGARRSPGEQVGTCRARADDDDRGHGGPMPYCPPLGEVVAVPGRLGPAGTDVFGAWGGTTPGVCWVLSYLPNLGLTVMWTLVS